MVSRIVKKTLRLLVTSVFQKFKSRRLSDLSPHVKPTVNMVTTWDTRCGIAAYSTFLTTELRRRVKLQIVNIPDKSAASPYFPILGFETGRSNSLVHVQFAYGMFSDLKLWKSKRLSTFAALLFYSGLAFGNSKVVTTFHELMKEAKTGSMIGVLYTKLLNKVICNVSDLIIVHTQENKRLMETLYGVDRLKIKVIPMGSPQMPIFLDKAECKRKLGLSEKVVITLPGFISRHKDHSIVVKLLPSLDKNVHLLIAGGTRTSEDVDYCKEVKHLVKQFNLVDRVTFNDDFPISPIILNATDIAILPYKYASESMALRLLVAYQVPTITSDLSVFREIYQEYGCMELFKTGDGNDFLAKTQSLLSDGQKRRSLKEKCRNMWNATKWSAIAAKHAETYLEVFSAHADALYDTDKQKERLDWLKANRSGISLEIGCATGFVTNYVGTDVGLDTNEYRLKLAKYRYQEKDFVVSNALYLPFKDKAFDTVLIPEILEHVPIPLAQKIVSEAQRTGKKMLITLPNAGKPNYDKSLVETPEHVWFPTKEIVQQLVKNCQIEFTRENDFILVHAT